VSLLYIRITIMNNYTIITPCYNEESVIEHFLRQLENTLKDIPANFNVIVVDDGSRITTKKILREFKFGHTNIALELLELPYNQGHQRAIFNGLNHAGKFPSQGYIVLDSDGEDDVEAIKKLVDFTDFEAVFVTRGKRQESLLFKISYSAYKTLFKLIIGKKLNFGNYSMINENIRQSIIAKNFIHYSAAISRLKISTEYIQFDRKKRISGTSKMNFRSLFMHGLKSMVEYSEEFLYFFIKILFLLILLSLLYITVILYKYFITKTAITGWSSTVLFGAINAILTSAGIIFIGLLNLKQNNN
jgi:glycosyltransferase involved in cell wall biosynthesis